MARPLPLPARFASFALIGGACLALNTLMLWALTAGLGINYLASTFVAFCLVTPLGFLANKVLTFRTRREYTPIELPRYLAALGVSVAANLALMWLLVSVLGAGYVPASLAVAGVLFLFNFAASDRWSFRAQR